MESNVKQQAVLDSLHKSRFLKASFLGKSFSPLSSGIRGTYPQWKGNLIECGYGEICQLSRALTFARTART